MNDTAKLITNTRLIIIKYCAITSWIQHLRKTVWIEKFVFQSPRWLSDEKAAILSIKVGTLWSQMMLVVNEGKWRNDNNDSIKQWYKNTRNQYSFLTFWFQANISSNKKYTHNYYRIPSQKQERVRYGNDKTEANVGRTYNILVSNFLLMDKRHYRLYKNITCWYNKYEIINLTKNFKHRLDFYHVFLFLLNYPICQTYNQVEQILKIVIAEHRRHCVETKFYITSDITVSPKIAWLVGIFIFLGVTEAKI